MHGYIKKRAYVFFYSFRLATAILKRMGNLY